MFKIFKNLVSQIQRLNQTRMSSIKSKLEFRSKIVLRPPYLDVNRIQKKKNRSTINKLQTSFYRLCYRAFYLSCYRLLKLFCSVSKFQCFVFVSSFYLVVPQTIKIELLKLFVVQSGNTDHSFSFNTLAQDAIRSPTFVRVCN